jgi:4-hydroxythreonine-4-phosphate dehydrogenase
MSLLVIADDLTGAADCAAAGAADGFSATVLLHSREIEGLDVGRIETDILSIDADTRCLVADQAEETTAELIRLCEARGLLGTGCLIFKKIDSTLRGNVAAELAAMLQAIRDFAHDGERASIILAPALPAQGRTTVGGRQMVRGNPLEESDIWKTGARAPHTDIPALLADAGLSCCLIDIAMVRSGLSQLRRPIEMDAQKADVVLFDAETDEDLRAIAKASMSINGDAIWAGSAGLASQIPHAAGMAGSGGALETNFARGPALFVVGSAASVSREQARVLAAMPEIAVIRVTPAVALNPDPIAARIIEALQSGRDVLVVPDQSESCRSDTVFSRALSKIIAPCASLLGGLVATGGETARAILDQLGIRRLRVLGEVEPGVPFCVADGWTRQLPVLTKAGAFGSPDTLVLCREFLHRLERSSTQAQSQSALTSSES